MGTAIFLVKGSLLIKVLVRELEADEVRKKNAVFQIPVKYINF